MLWKILFLVPTFDAALNKGILNIMRLYALPSFLTSIIAFGRGKSVLTAAPFRVYVNVESIARYNFDIFIS